MKKEKISEVIENVDEKYINEAAQFVSVKKDKHFKGPIKWIGLVAGIVIIVAISVAVYQNVSTKESGHKSKLEDGSVISFAEIKSLSMSEAKIAADGRELTKEEIGSLFGGLKITEATGYFDLKDSSIMGVSGMLDEIQIYVSASGKNIRDSIIKGKTETSYVKGVPVSAGYVVTGGSSQNKQTIIYFATLELNGNSVYLEHSGSYEDRNTIRNEIASAIEDLAQLGELGLILIKK